MANSSILRRTLTRTCRLLELGGLLVVPLLIYTLWYAMNSNADDIPPFLTHLIPAGNCACQTSTKFSCSSCLVPPPPATSPSLPSTWTYTYGRDESNRGLSESQCNAAFPGLYEDIYRATAFWRTRDNITMQHLDTLHSTLSSTPAITRARIHNANLYILSTNLQTENHRRKTLSTLSAMHRALTAYPDALPNSEFSFSVEDKAVDVLDLTTSPPLWTYARKASEESLFLLPDFGFYSWADNVKALHPQIGTYDEVVSRIQQTEPPISSKIPSLVWRGRLSFAPKLRRALLDQSRGQPWNAVREVDPRNPHNYLSLPDHCAYTFIAHAEGRASSASLKYRQACNSVVITHKLQYIQHHHHLLLSSGPEQNHVEVERDFSDLEEKMEMLLRSPELVERVARNSVKTFRERYLTPAAEACYWRELWRGYASVWEGGEETEARGMRFETFSLLPAKEMMQFKAL